MHSPVVAVDMNSAMIVSSATSGLIIGGVRDVASSTGGRGIQEESLHVQQAMEQTPSAVYNTGPLDQNRTDQA